MDTHLVAPFAVADPLALLREGEIELVSRVFEASNGTFLCRVRDSGPDGEAVATGAIYKPIRGERPLEDFPSGTLANREVAAYLVSEATGWSIVPPTVLREGPLGSGALQLWVELEPGVDRLRLLREGDPALRRMALFDAVVNNADRKVGHLVPVGGGHVFGVDHGICFAVEPKLRTVLWNWHGQPLSEDERATLERLDRAMAAALGEALRGILAAREVVATQRRVRSLLQIGRFPEPLPGRPAIPWPPY